VLWCSNRT